MPGTGAPHVQTHEKGASCSATHLAPLELNVGLRPLGRRDTFGSLGYRPTENKHHTHIYVTAYPCPYFNHTGVSQNVAFPPKGRKLWGCDDKPMNGCTPG